jgi:hypothetical protein
LSADRPPVALFAYRRTDTLARTLAGLRANGVRRLVAFSDAARTPDQAPEVEAVRRLLQEVDWAEVRLVERPRNLGLGVSVRTGVAEVLAEHESVVVFEDDLVCVPGTYDFLCAALERYRDAPDVLSVTGWTHPRVTPPGVQDPYFDGRTECWVWGTWRRAWQGMEKDALTLMAEAEARGIERDRYGADLEAMARVEHERNIWAVRWTYLHIARGGLCLRPPRSLVDHVGQDASATNAAATTDWLNPSLGPPPAPPVRWPEPVEHPGCAALWRRAYPPRRTGLRPALDALLARLRRG